jgi:hypothetical protein
MSLSKTVVVFLDSSAKLMRPEEAAVEMEKSYKYIQSKAPNRSEVFQR